MNTLQVQTPPLRGAHIVREDGQLSTLQHVFQFFVGYFKQDSSPFWKKKFIL